MKNLTCLLTLGSLIFAMNMPAQANTLSNNVHIVDRSNNATEVSPTTINSPSPGSDRR